MSDVVSAQFDDHQTEAFDQMEKEGDAENQSEALRRAANVGLHEMGYINGEKKETRLKATVHYVSWLFMVAGLVGLAFTIAYPVPARIPSFAVLTVGVVLYGVHEKLEDVEPDLSRRLARFVRGDSA